MTRKDVFALLFCSLIFWQMLAVKIVVIHLPPILLLSTVLIPPHYRFFLRVECYVITSMSRLIIVNRTNIFRKKLSNYVSNLLSIIITVVGRFSLIYLFSYLPYALK